ncbi:MAG TPA: cytochrome c [Gemmatimonadales bacterium]|nr:cytochrome c [Gemmatimonadales bacterium]
MFQSTTLRRATSALVASLAFAVVACGGDAKAPEGGEATPAPAPAQAAAIDGATEYAQTCSVCHQTNGEGMTGVYPPLAGSDIAILPSPDRMIAIVLKGLNGPVTVKGEKYDGTMAPWESLSDEQIAAITTYERSSWGNTSSAVTPEMVATIRAKVAGRTTAWTIEELEKEIP